MFIFVSMSNEKTTPVHIDKDIAKLIRKFVAEHGGTIKAVVEHGSLWATTKGAKEYIESLKK